MEADNTLLDDFILSLTRKRQPKVCFVPTASGDSDNYIARFYRAFHSSRCLPSHLTLFSGHPGNLSKFLCDQDVIYVGGGSTANMLAVWRVHAMDKAITAAWRKGVVLCGVSAGGMCWFETGVTDSLGGCLAPLHDGLGILKGAFYPHYHAKLANRPRPDREFWHRFPPAIAADDGVGLHFAGTRLLEAVSSRPEACAFRIRFVAGKLIETSIPTQYLGTS